MYGRLVESPSNPAVGDTAEIFPGGGETGALVRAFDWSKTPLGPAASWPASLRTLVSAMLQTRQPMIVWWGPELIQFYNDAYLPIVGKARHPAAMGQRARECWSEAWHIVGQLVRDVLAEGKASWDEDLLVPIFRNGSVEDAWWTFSYSPAFDDQGARLPA